MHSAQMYQTNACIKEMRPEKNFGFRQKIILQAELNFPDNIATQECLNLYRITGCCFSRISLQYFWTLFTIFMA